MTTTQDDRQISKDFFNEWVGAKGPRGWVSRYISNTGRWYTDMLIREGDIKPEDAVLDIGCGSASYIIDLLKEVSLEKAVCAVEPSEAQFELAQQNLADAKLTSKVDIRKGFASPLPFEADSFDVVYASFIFKHFADDTLTEALKDAYRVLKPGGRFLGWEFARVTNPVFKKLAKNPKKAMQNFREFDDFEPFLKKAGFNNIEEFEVKNRGFWDPVQDVGFMAVK